MDTLINYDKKLFLLIYNSTNQKFTKKLFRVITKVSKPFFIIAYVLLLIYTFLYFDKNTLIHILITPFMTILICKILRKKIGRKRPYLIFPDMNLQKKEDPSFPSNHTASSFIIALMFIFVSKPLCIVMLIIASLVSISRIIVGIHFPLDVLFAIIIALTIYCVS